MSRRMSPGWAIVILCLFALIFGAVRRDPHPVAPEGAAGPPRVGDAFLIAGSPAERLVLAGELYWTANGADAATVLRARIDAAPGPASVIYRRAGGRVTFGAVLAVGRQRFVVVNDVGGGSRIERMPATPGGQAVTVARTDDGVTVYFAGPGGIARHVLPDRTRDVRGCPRPTC